MTEQQLQLAIEMHDQGLTWSVIASYFKTTYSKLRKKLKTYEQTNSKIHEPS